MVQISIENLSFSYNQKLVLNNVSCKFTPGTFTAILGQNGSGKTTLIRCINKDHNHFKGEIKIGDKLLKELSTEELAIQIAFVPQGQDPVFGTTVFETILTGRLPFITWAPSQKDYDKVDEVIEKLNLAHLASKNINTLSGGERQKVYIARALVQDTPIIILDEPITYLDIKHQIEIIQILKNISLSGFNIVMIIHDLNLALKYCDEFIFLKNGQLLKLKINEITEDLVTSIFEFPVKKILANGDTFFFPNH